MRKLTDKEKAGLLLDTREAALAGGENGPVVLPGNPDESPLIRALRPEADPHMPPKKQLAEADIAKLRSWLVAAAETTVSRPVQVELQVPATWH